MKRTPVRINISEFPSEFHKLISGADVFDSSSSPEAKVYFIDSGDGFFLKSSAKGTLLREAEMTEYFYSKQLSCKVVEYISNGRDYLLTEKVRGEDGTFAGYMDDPKRMSVLMAEHLRMLHELDFSDCPIKDRIYEYLSLAKSNYKRGIFDNSYCIDDSVSKTPEQAWKYIECNKNMLSNTVLIHGDYCLPNIMFDNWNFSGFIDLGNAGVGDRHIDLFWGAWTLKFNFKSDKYREIFFDAYGRDKIDYEVIRLVSTIEAFG